MPNSAPSDIKYQPPVKGFSYSSPEAVQEQVVKEKKSIFYALGLELLGLLFLFFVFLAVLNYFSIVSLNSLNPTLFGWLPHLSSSKQNMSATSNINAVNDIYYSNSLKMWVANGTFEDFSDNKINISTSQGSYEYELIPITVYQTVLGINPKTSNLILSADTNLDELTRKENEGKSIKIYYTIDSNSKTRILKKVLLSQTSSFFQNLTLNPQ